MQVKWDEMFDVREENKLVKKPREKTKSKKYSKKSLAKKDSAKKTLKNLRNDP